MKPEQQLKKNYQSTKWYFCCNVEFKDYFEDKGTILFFQYAPL
jgi:hypothetical protein